LPPIVVVGIGYRATAMEELLPLRTRDFTPTVDSRYPGEDPAMMGGANRFLHSSVTS
jgi:predicted alpha/beta superfamily hydrolase